MTNKKILCLLVAMITITLCSCANNEKPVESILDSTSLRNGSVSLYHVTDNSGKVMKVLQNHVIEELSEMFFVQTYSASESEEIVRVKMAQKSLHLNKSEVVTMKNEENNASPEQKVVSSLERAGSNFFISDYSKGVQKNTRIFYDSFVMEQEVMVYLLNTFPFDSKSSASIHFINVRTQKEGDEIVSVVGKETRMFNKQEISVYKVSFSGSGGTAYYMEEKPHTLLGADFPSYKIVLIDWNGI
jgi:hypothetical protein